jgi:hypothetical protein
MWPAWRVGGAQTAIGPSQSPSRSLETARPVGRASALDCCPGAKDSGSRTDLLTPWPPGPRSSLSAHPSTGGPRSSLFDICRFSLEGKGRRTWGGTRLGDLPYFFPREKKYGHRTPPGPCVPTAGRLRRLSAPSPPQGGTLSEQESGIVVVVSSSSPCRVVVS